jgi:hypothetical protein
LLALLGSCLPAFGQSALADFVLQGDALVAYTGEARTVVISDALGIREIGDKAFAHSAVVSVTLPPGVEAIGDWAFWGCAELTDISLPEGLVRIGDWAFLGCTSLQRLSVPDSLISVGDWAFGNCSSLTAIETGEGNPAYAAVDGVLFDKSGTILTIYPGGKPNSEYIIPEQVELIRNLAFSGAVHLVTVRIPAGLRYIGNSAFYECAGLAGIEVDPENPEYHSSNGVLFDKAGATLLAYPGGSQNPAYSIPYGVTVIGDRAFYGCAGFTSILIPESVTNIGQEAFLGCVSLEAVILGRSVADIGDRAFYGCAGLSQILLFRSSRLGEDAFGAVPGELVYLD